MIAKLRVGLALVAAVVLVACGAPQQKAPADIAGLTQALISLDPVVDPAEAARAAEIAYTYSLVLRQEYNVTDGALLHNAKVNQGLRPRGLCWHWADDLQTRLRQEGFQTLDMHRAIANHDTILIEHSTVVMSAKSGKMREGIVLDPWRYGGYLFWSPVLEDKRYNWEERHVVQAGRTR